MKVTKKQIVEALLGYKALPVSANHEYRKQVADRIEAEGIEGVNEFVLDDEKWEAFQDILNRPVQNKPGLTKLLREPDVLSANGIDQLISEIDELCFDEASGGYFWPESIHPSVLKEITDKYRSTK